MGKIVAANWKMNLRRESASELGSALNADGRECWIFPAFPLIPPVAESIKGGKLRLGGQDLSPEPDGAFTGDVSAEMLKDAGCELVLVGHSERRMEHGEDGDLLKRKLTRALEAGLKPVYCVGEGIARRKAGEAQEYVGKQLDGLTLGRPTAEWPKLFAAVAYEPIWAIGTGETATPEQAEEMHAFIRDRLWKQGLTGVPVLYGGSVKPENAQALMSQPSVDGVLVGGASLKLDSLRAIDDVAREL